MISQRINFYQDRFREKRLWVSAGQLVVALLLLVLGAAAYSTLLMLDRNRAESERLRLDAEAEQLAADFTVANAELQRLLQDDRLDRQISDTRNEIAARQRVLRFVEVNRFGSGEGFSTYLEALSRLHVDDLWLNRILLSEDFIGIDGSSLDAARVPGYFDRFGEEAIFAGRRFDLFSVERRPDSDWKVDFSIATRERADG